MALAVEARELPATRALVAFPVARMRDGDLTPRRWAQLVKSCDGCRAFLDGRGMAHAAYLWTRGAKRLLSVSHFSWIDLPAAPMFAVALADVLRLAAATQASTATITDVEGLSESDETAARALGFVRSGASLVAHLAGA